MSTSAFKTLISGQYFAAIDVETTNCGPDANGRDVYRIIAIGVAVGLNGRRVAKKHWLVDPGVPVDAKSSAYNRITTADLVGARPSVKVLAAMHKFLAGYPDVIVLAHNAGFDVGLLNEEYDRTTLDRPGVDVIDTVRASKAFDPQTKRKRALAALVEFYGIINTLRGSNVRVRKAEKDALDTLDLWWKLAGAAADQGVEDMSAVLLASNAVAFEAVEFVVPRFVTRESPPPIPATHHKQAHGYRLPDQPSPADWVQFKHELDDCMRLRCYAASAKVAAEHAHYLTAATHASQLLGGVDAPGQAGTILGAFIPLFDYFTIRQARQWMKTNAPIVVDLPRCQPGSSCPACVAGAPCPQDMVYRALAPRLVAYDNGQSLYGKRITGDLLNVSQYGVRLNTWSWSPWSFFLAPVMALVLSAMAEDGLLIRYRQTLAECVARQLHYTDAQLGWMVARYWAGQHHFDQAREIVAFYADLDCTDPVVVQMEMWGADTLPALQTRAAKSAVHAEPKTLNPLRRRPKPATPRHRYQLF